jgi:leucyl-tRNA synthetase
MPYNPHEIEPRWQRYWEEHRTFEARELPGRKKFYALDMFPYPSGKGLHVGHPAGYTASDVVSRYRRALGDNVLHPMGYDAFGLPAEQKAIDEGVAPQLSTAEAIENFRRQLKRLGFSYDWSREISTCDPAFYKWTQWIFTQLYNRGLAYQADSFVNWCAGLGTVLANDEVIDGKSERGGYPVERKRMRQWMLRITSYADQLLAGLDDIDWPEETKKRQREWIGKSDGAYVDFPLDGRAETIKIFTTRPDTLWGATYMVLAPEHPLVETITTPAQRERVLAYQQATAARSELERQTAKQKTGVDTGARAINPVNAEAIPVWISDYVILGYGTGAIMAVPAHDDRDWEFARAMGLPVRAVIDGGTDAAPHTGEGAMIHSGPFDGTRTENGEAVKKVIAWLEDGKLGQGTITYKLRDWTFARQRYWGEPIPILKQDGAPVRALDVTELPLELPPVADYRPTGTGASPLSAVPSFVHAGERLERETDTMPGSAGSSWYFLRYCDPHNAAAFAARDRTDYWMPVDLYVGGREHSVGHLMYARMWQRFLHELGLVRDPEPFQKLRHQGMILGYSYVDATKQKLHVDDVEERDGKFYRRGTNEPLTQHVDKMSKRYGNVVNPDDVVREHGADALRIYICFMGPLDADKPWQTNGLEGQYNFLKRAWRLFFEADDRPRVDDSTATLEQRRILHKTIKKVTHDIESLDLNTAISALHIATRDLLETQTRAREILEPLAQLFAPFAPHFAEEVWAHGLGKHDGISFVPWPRHDDALAADDTITIGVQVGGKTYGSIEIARDADEATAVALAQAVPQVQRQLAGKTIVKVIYKAGRIVNLIAK